MTRLSQRDIVEKLDGKDAKATVEEVARSSPAGRSPAPSTPGRCSAMSWRASMSIAINDDPVKTYKRRRDVLRAVRVRPPGDEESGAAKAKTRLLAVIPHPGTPRRSRSPEKTGKKE